MSRSLLAFVATAIGGLLTTLSALVDPTFLIPHPDLALGIAFSTARGLNLAVPWFPYKQVMLFLVVVAIVLSLGKVYDKRTNNE